MKWQNFYKAGADENTVRDTRRANMRRLVLDRWRVGYLVDKAELRKADGRVIRIDQEGKNHA